MIDIADGNIFFVDRMMRNNQHTQIVNKANKTAKWLLALLCICIAVGLTFLSINRKYKDREKTDALKWVLEGDYEIVTSFYDLPKGIQDKILPPSFSESLHASYIRDFDLPEEEIEKIIDRDTIILGQMAEPNQPFNRSDMIEEVLPMRRFTIGGFSEDRAFLVYEHGGFAYNQKFIVLKRNRSVDMFFFGYCRRKVFSLDQLKSVIESGQIDEDPGSPQP